jgi:hypothetical protein
MRRRDLSGSVEDPCEMWEREREKERNANTSFLPQIARHRYTFHRTTLTVMADDSRVARVRFRGVAPALVWGLLDTTRNARQSRFVPWRGVVRARWFPRRVCLGCDGKVHVRPLQLMARRRRRGLARDVTAVVVVGGAALVVEANGGHGYREGRGGEFESECAYNWTSPA